MAYREVPVFEVREVLRLWLAGEGLRAVERLVGLDRKTVRRNVAAAEELGLDREAGDAQLSDVFVGQVVEAVRPHRVEGRGEAWRALAGRHEQLKQWLEIEKLAVVKAHELLEREGVIVPQRTLHRHALEVLGVGRGRGTTVRVTAGEPGDEVQVDFGRMGYLIDGGRRRVAWALIFTAC